MDIRTIDSDDEFLAIRVGWDSLLASDNAASVFMSWEWNYHWWRHYGRNQRLCIITAWNDGQLTGILPVYLQRATTFRVVPVCIVRFVGTGGDTSPDYLGPILDPATAAETASALIEFLLDRSHEWDILELSDLSADSSFHAELSRQCVTRGYRQRTRPTAKIVYASLPSTWEDYLATLHRDRRNTIRRTRRKLQQERDVRFRAVTDPRDFDAALDALIVLHRKRWHGREDGHAFSTPEYIGFHRDVVRACSSRDWIRFYCLEADGVTIAVFYCYRFRNQILYFQAGFDPDYERFRPGLVLIGHAIENAVAEGNTVFDFLRGDHAYKAQWGKSSRETHTLTAYRPGAGSVLYRLRKDVLPAAKRRLIGFLGLSRAQASELAGAPTAAA